MPEMTERIVSLLNSVAVGLFGIILSASFCDALQKRRDRIILLVCMVIMTVLHGIVLMNISDDTAVRLYPLIVHLPTVLVLYFITKKLLWSVISLLCAYLFCEIRRWFGLLAVFVLKGDGFTQDLVEFIITVPLLFFLIRFASPAIRQIMGSPYSVRHNPRHILYFRLSYPNLHRPSFRWLIGCTGVYALCLLCGLSYIFAA